jgi:prephenate dehydrogenase
MWSGICLENKYEVASVLGSLREKLMSFEELLKNSDSGAIIEFFEKAQRFRDSFAQTPSAYRRDHKLRVDVEDKPGSIATIATMLSVNGINIKNIGIVHSREYEGGVLEISFGSRDSLSKSRELLAGMNYLVYD